MNGQTSQTSQMFLIFPIRPAIAALPPMPQSRYQKRYAPGASRSSAGLILTRRATGATLARLIAYVDLQSGCPNTRQADARVFPPSKSLERIGDDPHRGRFPLLDATDDDEEEVVLALTARSTWLG